MNRRRWFAWRGTAVLFWMLLALVITVDMESNLRKTEPDLRETGGTEEVLSRPRGYVALTFDDGPHAVYTPRLLDGLRKRGIRASFFLIGQNIAGNEDIVRQMKKDGHLIGNHSQSHMQLTAENVSSAYDQILWTNQKIRDVTGVQPSHIRPPYGSWSDELAELVPMTVVLWNLDPLDWKSQNKEKIVEYVASHAEDGSIILLHDVYETSVDAALEIVDVLTGAGYEFVTVDELLIE